MSVSDCLRGNTGFPMNARENDEYGGTGKVNKEEAKCNTESKFCVEIQYTPSTEEALFPVNKSSKPSASSVSLELE